MFLGQKQLALCDFEVVDGYAFEVSDWLSVHESSKLGKWRNRRVCSRYNTEMRANRVATVQPCEMNRAKKSKKFEKYFSRAFLGPPKIHVTPR